MACGVFVFALERPYERRLDSVLSFWNSGFLVCTGLILTLLLSINQFRPVEVLWDCRRELLSFLYTYILSE